MVAGSLTCRTVLLAYVFYFLEKLEAVGVDNKTFGLHSLRAGGTCAAANAGVPDRMFKRHGRWRSENAKDGYVKDSLDGRLNVS